MKVDFSTTFTDPLDGQTVMSPSKDGDPTPMTLASVAYQALTIQGEQDRNRTGEDKYRAGVLGERILKGGEVELTAEEASLLKKRIGMFFGVLTVRQSWDLLDGK